MKKEYNFKLFQFQRELMFVIFFSLSLIISTSSCRKKIHPKKILKQWSDMKNVVNEFLTYSKDSINAENKQKFKDDILTFREIDKYKQYYLNPDLNKWLHLEQYEEELMIYTPICQYPNKEHIKYIGVLFGGKLIKYKKNLPCSKINLTHSQARVCPYGLGLST